MSFVVGMRGHDLGRLPLLEIIKKAKETNVTNIQLAPSKAISDIDFKYGSFSPSLAGYIGEELYKNGIHISVLGSYINPINPDPKGRKAELDIFKENLRYAKYMNADMVGTETGSFNIDNHPNNEVTRTEGCFKIFLESMYPLINEAEKLGVMIGIEGTTDHTLYTPEIIKEFLDYFNSPNVCIIFDAVNLLTPEHAGNQANFYKKAFDLFGERIGAMHIKDFVVADGKKKNAPVGKGLMDYKSLFSELKSRKPFICNLIEGSTPERYPEEAEYLRNIYEGV